MFITSRSLLLIGLSQVCVLLIAPIGTAEEMVTPLSLHPENDRYFLFRGKPTILVTSAEHYGLLLNRAFDYRAYFDELASHGLNHTRVFSGAYREVASSFGITQNTLAPADENYICPWKRSTRTHKDGAPIFDLQKWDEAYFERLDAMLAAASERGIIVELCLFCPMYKPELWEVNPMNARNNVNDVGNCEPTEVYTLEDFSSPGGVGRELRRQLSVLKSTFDQLPIPHLRPIPKLFEAPAGFVASAIGQPGQVYLVYLQIEVPGRLRDQSPGRYKRTIRDLRLEVSLPAGRYRVRQLDTRSGRTSDLPSMKSNGTQPASLKLAQFVTDTALLINLQP